MRFGRQARGRRPPSPKTAPSTVIRCRRRITKTGRDQKRCQLCASELLTQLARDGPTECRTCLFPKMDVLNTRHREISERCPETVRVDLILLGVKDDANRKLERHQDEIGTGLRAE